MNKHDSYVDGIIYFQGNKESLSSIFEVSGISNSVGEWAIRFCNCNAKFKIAYVGNITPNEPYEVEADGYGINPIEVSHWCEKLSEVLMKNSIRFEITHFNSEGEEIKNYLA